MKIFQNEASVDNKKLGILEDLREAFSNVKLHEAGKKKLLTAKELLKDLDVKNKQSQNE